MWSPALSSASSWPEPTEQQGLTTPLLPRHGSPSNHRFLSGQQKAVTQPVSSLASTGWRSPAQNRSNPSDSNAHERSADI